MITNLLPDPAQRDLHIDRNCSNVAVEVTLPWMIGQWVRSVALDFGVALSDVLLAVFRLSLHIANHYPRATDPATPLARAILPDDQLAVRAANLQRAMIGLTNRLRSEIVRILLARNASNETATAAREPAAVSLAPGPDDEIDELPQPVIQRLAAIPCDLLRQLEDLAVKRNVNVDEMMIQAALTIMWLDLNFPSLGVPTLAEDFMGKIAACERLAKNIEQILAQLDVTVAEFHRVVEPLVEEFPTS